MNFFDFQTEALNQTADQNRVAYYMDMGLGKTFVGAEKLVRLGARVNLIICQKSKVRDWIDHVRKYYSYPGNLESGCNPYQVIDLTMFKQKDWDDDEKFITGLVAGQIVYVINYELAFRRPALKRLSRFTLMLDESSMIQNDTAKRTKFILELTPENVILLSGTPTSGKYENLWSQAHLLGWNIPKKLYNQHYVNWIKMEVDGFPVWVVDSHNPYKNVDRLKEKFRENGAFFKKTNECFELPEQNMIPIYVQATKEYRDFLKTGLIQIGDVELVGDTTLAKRTYTRMLCGHYNQAKLNAFRNLLQSTNDRLIVFYNFTAEMTAMKVITDQMERPVSIVSGATKDLTAYEEEENSVTFIQYQAGAMGLNLQKANKAIYFTLTDKSELFEQSKKRIHRIGQNRPCFYYLLMCERTVEILILQTLEQRRDFTDALFKENIGG